MASQKDFEGLSLTSTESLMRLYVLSSLGFNTTMIERGLVDKFFRLPTGSRIKFDLDAMLSGSASDKAEMYSKSILGGYMSPNECRSKEDLSPVEHGDDVRVQQQLVPLSYGAAMQPTPVAQPAPVPEPEPEPRKAEREARVEMLREQFSSAIH